MGRVTSPPGEEPQQQSSNELHHLQVASQEESADQEDPKYELYEDAAGADCWPDLSQLLQGWQGELLGGRMQGI